MYNSIIRILNLIASRSHAIILNILSVSKESDSNV